MRNINSVYSIDGVTYNGMCAWYSYAICTFSNKYKINKFLPLTKISAITVLHIQWCTPYGVYSTVIAEIGHVPGMVSSCSTKRRHLAYARVIEPPEKVTAIALRLKSSSSVEFTKLEQLARQAN